MAQTAERLVALAPALAAASDRKALEEVSSRLGEGRTVFSGQLQELREAGSAHGRFEAILTASRALLDNLAALDGVSADRITLAERRAALLPRIVEAGTQVQRVASTLVPSLIRTPGESMSG
ncbi:hypothetical protein [Azospirillum sp. TSO22-1]|uniref:hypothetical protein n=1 Tax=Azospirillum sp. TSO22-1 TaxID=716789 RepID=UPI000D61AE51|nr:hypothetical protein [Azospirillum sp. TSO22-1]PWC32038.1 hypothetical protein TSO221_31770 [Azospirillum sp. TSO22-1]